MKKSSSSRVRIIHQKKIGFLAAGTAMPPILLLPIGGDKRGGINLKYQIS